MAQLSGALKPLQKITQTADRPNEMMIGLCRSRSDLKIKEITLGFGQMNMDSKENNPNP